MTPSVGEKESFYEINVILWERGVLGQKCLERINNINKDIHLTFLRARLYVQICSFLIE